MFGKTEVAKKFLHHTFLSIDLYGVPVFIAKSSFNCSTEHIVKRNQEYLFFFSDSPYNLKFAHTIKRFILPCAY
jgi:hypothetical protein